jgi:hypothetical protein
MIHPTPPVRAPARARRAYPILAVLVLALGVLFAACNNGGSTAAPGGATTGPGETMGLETTAPTSGY